MKIGSLFSGVAGLDRAVESFFDAQVAWFVEFDKAPSKVLAHHYPGVPNYGDVTAVDWANVEPIDILTGGFPCQDVSLAGARRGLRDGTRSGLWSEYAKAIDILRPKLVVIENVRGLLSAQTIEEVEDASDSELEPGQGSVGEPARGDRPVLNAFGRVLGDLAALGYDAEWVGLRAADAGAPHNRFRVFCVAYPVGERWGEGRAKSAGRGGRLAPVLSGSLDAYAGNCDDPHYGRPAVAPDAGSVGLQEGRLPSGSVAEQPESANGFVLLPGGNGEAQGGSGGPATASNPSGERFGEHSGESLAEEAGTPGGHVVASAGGLRADTNWGPYRPAIERWERVTGRMAPPPTNPDGRDGSHRLSAEFVTWMMGWPDAWVTDPAIGLTRNEQLKACGNGVVTQQAYLALQAIAKRMGAAA